MINEPIRYRSNDVQNRESSVVSSRGVSNTRVEGLTSYLLQAKRGKGKITR
jgi:hypothetical protein